MHVRVRMKKKKKKKQKWPVEMGTVKAVTCFQGKDESLLVISKRDQIL